MFHFYLFFKQTCNQDSVNVLVGCWWTITFLFSLCFVRRIPYHDQKPQDGEVLLVSDQASPVGYKVPSLPDFEIDPSLAYTGNKCVSMNFEFLLGLIVAVSVGVGLISRTISTWQHNLSSAA